MATILIIDDDPTTLGLLRTRLEKAGHKVREAKDGQEGLKMAERERPDLVFLDVRMPKVDGWQVCRTLKSNPVTTQCPVIILTGCSQDVQELYGLQCGADEYFTKPWDARQLMETTTRLLSQASTAQDPRSNAFQARTRQFVQRVVKLAGRLPKTPNVEMMSTQLLQIATSMVAAYQSAVSNGAAEFRLKMNGIDQQAGELIYWLGLLRDSQTLQDPEIDMLIAEASILRSTFSGYTKKSSRK